MSDNQKQSLAFFKMELAKDIRIDGTRLSDELINNSYIYSKWANYMADIKISLMRAEANRKRVNANRLNFYTGRSTDEICDYVYDNITELRIILAADNQVLKAETEYAIYDNILTFIIRAMEAIKGRGFDIKAAMEQRQFEQGR